MVESDGIVVRVESLNCKEQLENFHLFGLDVVRISTLDYYRDIMNSATQDHY